MLLVTPGYTLTTSGKLYPIPGCMLVSGGQLLSDGRIHWDHEALEVVTPFGNAQERKT